MGQELQDHQSHVAMTSDRDSCADVIAWQRVVIANWTSGQRITATRVLKSRSEGVEISAKVSERDLEMSSTASFWKSFLCFLCIKMNEWMKEGRKEWTKLHQGYSSLPHKFLEHTKSKGSFLTRHHHHCAVQSCLSQELQPRQQVIVLK